MDIQVVFLAVPIYDWIELELGISNLVFHLTKKEKKNKT